MVAYTSPDCLPYFTASDPICVNTGTVCDPSTVWCDFAEAVDLKLTSYDEVVTRTAESTPMAWVETFVPFSWEVSQSIYPVFDAVRADTADMVDLAVNPSGFAITRAGFYAVFAFAQGTFVNISGGSITPGTNIAIQPPSTAQGLWTVNGLECDGYAETNGQLVTIGTNMTVPLQAGQRLVMNITGGGTSGDSILFSRLSMGAAWMGEIA